MPSFRTQFSVGLFVVAGMAVVVVFILWLGLVQYFAEGRKYTAFFDESVQGLQKDSAVKYRGVDIGRVDSIQVAPDGRLVQIVLDLREPLKNKDEIYAQIKSVGITGIMFVELERIPEGASIEPPEFGFEPKHPVIATKPSEIKQLITDLYAIVAEIGKIDFSRLADNAAATLENVNQTLSEARITEISERARKTLASAEELIAPEKWGPIRENVERSTRRLDRLIGKTGDSIDDAARSLSAQNRRLTESMEKFQNAVENADRMMAQGSLLIENTDRRMARIHQQVNSALLHLESVSGNLNRLLDDLAAQPSRLFFSDPPPARGFGGKGE